jgi:dihydrofolate reductase
MNNQNLVFIATSLDGYIADRNGGLDWLESVPNPDNQDLGYDKFIDRVDAIVMGKITFETVCNFDCPWPYSKPVFVLSNSLSELPKEHKEKGEIVNGNLKDIIKRLNEREYNSLYIDGGVTVQNFLKEDLIDELIITTIPILLGGGIPLFTELPQELNFDLVESEVYLNALVQSRFKRKR